MKKSVTHTKSHAEAHSTWSKGGVAAVITIVSLALLYTVYSGWVSREWLRSTTEFDSPEPLMMDTQLEGTPEQMDTSELEQGQDVDHLMVPGQYDPSMPNADRI